MKLLIAGSRSLVPSPAAIDQALLELMAEQCTVIVPTQVLSGSARGVDRAGELWAIARGYDVIRLPADWARHGRAAGPRRNAGLVAACDGALVWWDGISPGTRDAIERLVDAGKPHYVTRP